MIHKPCYMFIFLLCVLATLSANAMQQSAVTTGQLLSEAQAEAQATYIQALQAFENEQYEQALDLMKSAYPQISKNSGANFALADIYFQLGKNDEAIQYARQAVALDKKNKWCHLKLADLYQATGQHSDAINQLEVTHKLFPKDTNVLNKLAVAYANEGSLEKAKEQYNHLLNLGEPSMALRIQKLKIFSLLGLDDSLTVELDKILKLQPTKATTFKLLSSYYRDLGNNAMAQQMLKKAGLTMPKNINTLKRRAETYIAASTWDSLRTFGISVMNDSLLAPDQKMDFARSIYSTFETEISSFPAETLESILHAFLKNDPDYMPARMLSSDFFMSTGQPKKALAELAEINTSMPNNKEAWVQRLHLLMEQGDTKKALKTALQANEQFPQDAFIYYAIGHSYLATNNYSKALDWLKKGNDLPARSPLKYDILQTLGETYMQLEQWQDAFDSYQKAFDYDEPGAQAMEHMGDILHKLGKPVEARAWWQKALRENPDDKELREKISQ